MSRCVQEVSNYIVWDSHEAGSYLTLAKLQKLMYLAQARHLAIHGRPLFPGKFEAWAHGPALRSVHKRFEKYGWRNIDEFIPKPAIDPDAEKFLKCVLDEFGSFDARQLQAITNRDEAWIAARQGAPETIDGRWEGVISESLMRDAQRRRLNLEPAEV
ncbi:Panacea domain-containing protein [Paludisphaera rhizosphaerae]|uniref:Panacea domain-containing protein n=1 Tax=Paludisphaera rhizosphaerae TaxID=2711216 RepID=UPI0013ECAF06|nr:type II toxin-antitoxin system antitoxin SocA domain-containing protein [Paludisphaera rhizosphaerae]